MEPEIHVTLDNVSFHMEEGLTIPSQGEGTHSKTDTAHMSPNCMLKCCASDLELLPTENDDIPDKDKLSTHSDTTNFSETPAVIEISTTTST